MKWALVEGLSPGTLTVHGGSGDTSQPSEWQSGERIQNHLSNFIDAHFHIGHDADGIALRLRWFEFWIAAAVIAAALVFLHSIFRLYRS
jgi:hypothetical protein